MYVAGVNAVGTAAKMLSRGGDRLVDVDHCPVRETPDLGAAARYYARPGIAYRPVTGVSPSQVGAAWPPVNDTDPAVQDFVRCCLDNRPGEP